MSCLRRNGSSRTVSPAATIRFAATYFPNTSGRGRESNVKRTEASSAVAGGASIWANSG